ncbi:hypothetical protein EJB05_48722 [Eragrostis curvula]|uniref:Uncharacterized protein n=1 Tax=Eragrostis curvula TaxID=38414 RepID=A0A5J9T2F7_9POAL|nr:hypothetical protein EJB05_48722 [Eragrostis curvula]
MTDSGPSGSQSWLHVGKLAQLEHDVGHLNYRRILLETPSGFSLFDVHKVLFKAPEHMWSYLTDEGSAHEVVFAIGFAKVEDKSIARNTNDGPGKELSTLIRKLCTHRNDLVVQDDELKVAIEENLKVKCSTAVDTLSDLMWGLKFVLHAFIPQEKDNLSNDYYLPLCKGLQNALEKHKLDVSQGHEMDRDFLQMLGHVEQLQLNQKLTLNKFRKFFDYLFHDIGEKFKDNSIYRAVLKYIFLDNINSPDIQFNHDVSEELFESIRGSVNPHERLWVVTVLQYLDILDKQISYALEYLNIKLGGSQKNPVIQAKLQTILAEFQRIEPEEGILDGWLVAMMKTDLERRGGGVEKGGKNDLHVADKTMLYNCVDVLDTLVETTTLIKADSLAGMTAEDGLSHVEKDTALQVDETSPQVEETAPQVEEETSMKVEEEKAPQVEETYMKVEETYMKVEETSMKVEEETFMKVEETSMKVEETSMMVGEETAPHMKVEEETAPQIDETIPQVKKKAAKVDEEITAQVVSKGASLEGDGNTRKGFRFPVPLLGMSLCGIMAAMFLSSKATKSRI